MTVEIFTVIDFSTFDKWVALSVAYGSELVIVIFIINKYIINCLRFYNISKAKSHEGRTEDARKTIHYIFTHIMEGVCQIN